MKIEGCEMKNGNSVEFWFGDRVKRKLGLSMVDGEAMVREMERKRKRYVN